VDASTTTVPGDPTALTAAASGRTLIQLSWSAPTDDGGSSITGYRIKRSNDGSTGWADVEDDTESAATTYVDRGLNPGAARHYRVRAINGEGTGIYSIAASATTVAANVASIPSDPTGLTATASGATTINLSWTAPANNGGSAISGYRIEASADGSTNWADIEDDTESAATTYSHTGLTTGATRYYRVYAINATGQSLASTIDDATTAAVTVPSAPTGVEGFANSTANIRVAWQAPASDGGSAITGYRIQWSTDGSIPWMDVSPASMGTALRYIDRNLGRGVTRHYRVYASNSVGEGPASTSGSGTSRPPTVPANPTSPTATAVGRTVIQLSWTAPSFTGGSPITGYRISRSIDGGITYTPLATTTETTYIHRGLTAGVLGAYQINTLNSVGASNSISASANTVDASTTTVPGDPTALTAAASGRTLIQLSWTAPTDDGGSAVTGYRIERSNDGSTGWADVEDDTESTATTYLDRGLNPGVTRSYRVRAINGKGTGIYSIAASATTVAGNVASIPSDPTELEATAGGLTSINLSWTAPANNGGSRISGYRIEGSPNGSTNWSDVEDDTESTLTTYTDTGLSPSTTRYYRVYAINTTGESLASNIDDATTVALTVPSAPRSLVAAASGQTAITLAWQAPTSNGGSPLTGYRIQWSADGSDPWANVSPAHTGTGRTYSDTGLSPGTTRHYRVYAKNTVGDSPASNTDDATTAAATAPSAPRDLKATASGQTAINLSWTAPSSNGGSAITGYKIEVSPNGTNNWTDLIANTNSVATTYSHTDLSPSTARHYRVRSINAVHTSVASNVATATTVAPNATRPSAPQTLVATASGQTAINLAWQAPASNGGSPLTGYRAQWSADGRDSWADVSPAHSGTGRSYSDTGLDPLTTRHYRVYAKNAVGESTSPSNTDDATTAATTAPSAPRTLVATASGRRAINLGWQAPASDGGSAITGYRIQWSADGRNPWTDMSPAHTGTGRTYSDTGLDPGATRHYRVYAKNSVGDSPASNTDDATTGAITAPGAPTDLSATAAGPTSITVTWTAPNNDGGAAITGYNIEVSPNWTSAWTELVANTASTATSYTHTGLTARVTRHYRVSAINSVETGSASSTASATTSAATAPGAPASLSATAAGPTSITLSWTAPTTTGGAPITGYKIEASSNGTSNWADLEANTASTATTYTHTGLTAAATRHYRVSAINSEGDGPASSTVNATTSAVTAPGAPTSLSATAAGTTSITLSWTPPKNTGGAAITGYKIEVSPNGTSDWADLEANTGTTVTTYTHSGLTASTIRHYRVRAINSVGAGSASTTARATTDASNATRPQAPTSLTASASGRTTINLSWQAPTDNGGSSITGYRVQWSADGNDPWTDVSPAHTGTGRTYSDTNLAPSIARHYRVYAINSVGESTSASNTDDATTDAVSAPSAPTALTATAQGSTIINLQWVAPLDDGGATITGYAIEVSLDGISSWATLVDNTNAATVSYSHTGLAAGVTRHYRVRAINAVDAGSASNIATATTTSATAPSAPTALSTTPAGPTRMDLSWTAPVDDGGAAITAYAIEVSPNGTSLWTNLETSTGSAATDYTHTDLTGATTYHYRVRAINAGGGYRESVQRRQRDHKRIHRSRCAFTAHSRSDQHDHDGAVMECTFEQRRGSDHRLQH